MTQIYKMKISPEDAAALLETNYRGNRPIRKYWVHQLADMMRKGQFISQNGQTIVIGRDDGVLYDGQHRLYAIIESGMTFTFDIALIDNAEAAYMTIDNGTKRKASDFVEGAQKNASAAVAKACYCIEYGSMPLPTAIQGKFDSSRSASRIETTTYAREHADEISRYLKCAGKLKRAIGAGTETNYAIFCYLVEHYGDATLLDEFIDEVANSMTSNNTIRAFTTLVRKSYLSVRKPTRLWLIGTTIHAYEHFCAMDGMTMLNKAAYVIDQYSKRIASSRQGAVA